MHIGDRNENRAAKALETDVRLNVARHRLRRGPVLTHEVIRSADVQTGLVDYLSGSGAGLCVLGTQGEHPERTTLGRVAGAAARSAPIPVLLVPDPSRAERRPQGATYPERRPGIQLVAPPPGPVG